MAEFWSLFSSLLQMAIFLSPLATEISLKWKFLALFCNFLVKMSSLKF